MDNIIGIFYIWLLIFPLSLYLSNTDLKLNNSNYLKRFSDVSRFLAKNGILITTIILIILLAIGYIVAAKIYTQIFSSYSDAAITNAKIQGINYIRETLGFLSPLALFIFVLQPLIISATFIHYKLVKRARYIILFILTLLFVYPLSNILLFLIMLIVINIMIKKDKSYKTDIKPVE